MGLLTRTLVLSALLLALSIPAAAQVQPVVQRPSTTTSATLQSAATANGNGTAWDASGYSIVVFVASCPAAGETIHFEGSPDNSEWRGLWSEQLATGTAPALVQSYTPGSFTTVWQTQLKGLRYFRVRIAGYVSGAITVTAYGSMAAPASPTVVVASSALPTNAAIETGGNLASLLASLDALSAIVTLPITVPGLDGTLATSVQGVTGMIPLQTVVSSALPAGSNNIGDVDVLSLPSVTIGTFPDNEPINIAQMNGVAVSMGNGASGTGVQRVTLANDSTGTVAATQSGTWNVTNISGTVSLPTGASTLTEQQSQTTALQLIDDVVHSSDAALGKVAAIGAQLDDTSPGTTTENNVRPLRMSTRRELYSQIRDAAGNERGANVTASNALVVDGSGVTQPVSGTVTVGTFPDNEPFNVAQINGVTPLMGAGNTGTGSPRVTIATDQAALAGMGVGAVGSAPPTNANYLGGLGSGATAGLTTAVTSCDSQAFLDMSTATTTELVALTSSRKIYVCYWLANSDGATTMTFKRGTGTNCGTGTTSISPGWKLAANAGFSGGSGLGAIFDNQNAGDALCVTSSAAVNLQIYVRYAKY